MRIRFISDLHYADPKHFSADRAEAHEFYIRTVIDHLFAKEADLYLSLGDLVHGGTAVEIEKIYGWIGGYAESQVKFVHISGNHDLDFRGRLEWPAQYYKGNHFQSYEGFHIIFLETAREKNRENYGGYLSPEVLSWLSEKIDQTGQDPLLIFAHHSLKDKPRLSWKKMMYVDEACKLDQILAKKQGPGIYINAHNHCDSILQEGNWTYLQAACELEYPTIKNIEIGADQLYFYHEEIRSAEMNTARSHFMVEIPSFTPLGIAARGTVLERELKLTFK